MYTNKDYKSNLTVKWCPGCGDHAVLASLHKSLADIGVAPKDIVVVSGIGCSSRLTYSRTRSRYRLRRQGCQSAFECLAGDRRRRLSRYRRQPLYTQRQT